MIALLLPIIVNTNLAPCDSVGMIDPAAVQTVIEREGTSYRYADLDLFLTNDGEFRLYRTASPFLHPLHGRLVILAHNLTVNDESYRAMLEERVERPASCELAHSRPRA